MGAGRGRGRRLIRVGIQGPPGTGKSYIGLQLMKVLLGVKEKADLGPILVVYVLSLCSLWLILG